MLAIVIVLFAANPRVCGTREHRCETQDLPEAHYLVMVSGSSLSLRRLHDRWSTSYILCSSKWHSTSTGTDKKGLPQVG